MSIEVTLLGAPMSLEERRERMDELGVGWRSHGNIPNMLSAIWKVGLLTHNNAHMQQFRMRPCKRYPECKHNRGAAGDLEHSVWADF